MPTERILGTDTGKEAFEKANKNFKILDNKDAELNNKTINTAERIGRYNKGTRFNVGLKFNTKPFTEEELNELK